MNLCFHITVGADCSPGCSGGWLELIPKLCDVGIDVRSPGSHMTVIPVFKWVGNRIKRVVSVLHSGYRAHIAVKSLCDVFTFDLKIQQPNGLVYAIFAETWYAYKQFVLLLNLFSCFAGLCSTRIPRYVYQY